MKTNDGNRKIAILPSCSFVPPFHFSQAPIVGRHERLKMRDGRELSDKSKKNLPKIKKRNCSELSLFHDLHFVSGSDSAPSQGAEDQKLPGAFIKPQTKTRRIRPLKGLTKAFQRRFKGLQKVFKRPFEGRLNPFQSLFEGLVKVFTRPFKGLFRG